MAAHDLDPLFPPRPRRRLWHRLTLWLARRRQERRMEMLRREAHHIPPPTKTQPDRLLTSL